MAHQWGGVLVRVLPRAPALSLRSRLRMAKRGAAESPPSGRCVELGPALIARHPSPISPKLLGLNGCKKSPGETSREAFPEELVAFIPAGEHPRLTGMYGRDSSAVRIF